MKQNKKVVSATHQKLASVPIELILTTLPFKEVDNTLWVKTNEDYTLTINSGMDTRDRNNIKPYGIPYGLYPRLLLYYICTEAKSKKTQNIHLGNSFLDMFKRINLTDKKTGGRGINNFKNQTLRLCTSQITLHYNKTTNQESYFEYKPFNLVNGLRLWEKQNEFDFEITLTTDFYNYIHNSSTIPFDYEIIHMLKSSPLLIDTYIFLNYKAWAANKFQKDLFIPFEALYKAFGSDSAFKEFKRNLTKNLVKLMEVHPSLYLKKITKDNKDGVEVSKTSSSNVDPKGQLFLFNTKEELEN